MNIEMSSLVRRRMRPGGNPARLLRHGVAGLPVLFCMLCCCVTHAFGQHEVVDLVPGSGIRQDAILHDTQADWYRAYLTTGVRYRVQVNDLTIRDTMLTWCSSLNGATLSATSTVFAGDTAALELAPRTRAGDFYFKVQGFAEFTTGQYEIAVFWEYQPATDSDQDGIPDWAETDTGTWSAYYNTGTDPDLADSDGDNWNDWAEVRRRTDPTDPLSFPTSVQGDFDGDGKADVGVFWAQAGRWYIHQSGNSLARLVDWGWSEVLPVAADYDGDGLADPAVYWPEGGNWYILRSGAESLVLNLGWRDTDPCPADFDGDGRTDIAVYWPDTGTWYIRRSGDGGIYSLQWGWSGADPVPADYDGDGIDDVAVFERSNGNWYILSSATGNPVIINWGWTAAIPVPADYDGDGTDDITVYWPDIGNWYIRQSGDQQVLVINWGWTAAIPVPADYDGDGIVDIGVFNPADGTWYLRLSATGNVHVENWGWSDVTPVRVR